MIKVLQLTKHFPPFNGGIESVTHDLTEGLARRGYSVDVLCCNDSNRTVESVNPQYRVIRAGRLFKAFSTSVSPSLIRQLWKVRSTYDIIHVHLPDPMAVLAIFLCRPKSKLIIHWHSDIVKQSTLLRLFAPLQNWILKRCVNVIGTSPLYIKESRQLRHFQKKCVSIPIGIDSKRIKVNEDLVRDLSARYKGKKIVFSLGRLVYYKGFNFLVEAASFLDDNVIVLMGGAGPLDRPLRSQIERLGLNEKVKLLGRITDEQVSSILSISSLFCFPSTKKSEAFGVVQLEAMYLGVPIVATNIPGSGVPWVNQHNVTGLNVSVENSKELGLAMQAILNDRNLAKRFSINGKRRYQDLFTCGRMIQLVEALYHSVMRGTE